MPKQELKNASGTVTIILDPEQGTVTVGGGGVDGELFVLGNNPRTEVMRFFVFRDHNAQLHIGASGHEGDLFINHSSGNPSLVYRGQNAELTIGGPDAEGQIDVTDTQGNIVFSVEGDGVFVGAPREISPVSETNPVMIFGGSATVSVGTVGLPGSITVLDGETEIIGLDGESHELRLSFGDDVTFKVRRGDITAGGGPAPGSLTLSGGVDRPAATVSVSGRQGQLVLGAGRTSQAPDGVVGHIALVNDTGEQRLELLGSGELTLRNKDKKVRVRITETGIVLSNRKGSPRLELDGEAGDVKLRGADCAEEFDIAAGVDATPGMVMILDADGKLQPCDRPYDCRAVGVVSGAGEFSSGITLDSVGGPARASLALVGKTYCLVDADRSPVEIGDPLTTSPTLGHAMKAADLQRGLGALVGKALKPLAAGRALVPMLVALQ